MQDSRQVNLTLDFCMRVGELLLASGAGAADVTAVIRSLARHLGLFNAETDVTFISINMHHQANPEDPPVFATRQIKQREMDYDLLTDLDHLVREVLNDRLDLMRARSALARIVSAPPKRARWKITLGYGVMCAGFATMLGGHWFVAMLAFLSAVIIERVHHSMKRRRLPEFYLQIAGGGVATLVAIAATTAATPGDVSQLITANIIMLLAGLGFVGAIQDALTGFYITSVARILEVILATGGIIVGVSGGLGLASLMQVEIPRADTRRIGMVTDLSDLGLLMLGGAVGAAAFAYTAYAPRRILLPVAAVASIGAVIAQTLTLPGIGRTWGVGIAAVFVGLVSYSVAGRMRVPPLIVVVACVVPMLPGLAIYRALSLMGGDSGLDVATGLLSMMTAASVAVALAAGVLLGEYIAQPLKGGARRIETRIRPPGAGAPRLVGPVRDRIRPRRRRQHQYQHQQDVS